MKTLCKIKAYTLKMILFLLVSASAQAQVSIYGYDGTYLGNLSSNRYDPNSVSNPYGKYGSKYSSTSIRNPYSKWGNPYSPYSATNPYATSAPKIYGSNRRQNKGFFSIDP